MACGASSSNVGAGVEASWLSLGPIAGAESSSSTFVSVMKMMLALLPSMSESEAWSAVLMLESLMYLSMMQSSGTWSMKHLPHIMATRCDIGVGWAGGCGSP